MYSIVTFYKFVAIQDVLSIKEQIYSYCKEHQIKGTVLLAHEGINATLVGKRENIQKFCEFISSFHAFNDISFQETFAEFMPFQKIKVKIKPEIVAFKTRDFDITQRGEYINPEHWDEFLCAQDVKVIDVRNYYEVAMGSFRKAINPHTNNFSDFIVWISENFKQESLDQPIGMFCTGGVRCEKSTSYLRKLGFKNVYHLKGGILNYLKHKQTSVNLWEGSCFIFDDRLALDAELNPINP